MRVLQKVIKYLALAFAIYLIVNIFMAIAFGIEGLSGVFGSSSSNSKKFEEIISNYESTDAKVLVIDIDAAEIKIIEGDSLKVDSNSKYINATIDKDKLYISEKKHNWFRHDDMEVVVYVPNNIVFDEVNIKSGAGKIEADSIITNVLDLNLGAGKVDINNLVVTNKATIEGGAGSFNINDGRINYLNLDMGVGKTTIRSNLTGNSKIKAGIGKLDIILLNNINNYKIKTSKGIGSININGTSQEDDSVYGNGINFIDIEGGIGSIDINSEM